ncbi:unnamed protein product [Pocillopora meandrina]|uniref:Transmembrane protein n=1 Tax=Pocillopora meandrina TaxID=46732 RepID=A0AAU9VNR7_9CNID|nr:unnamed protein product [Pocillopora meandrina]
MKYVVTVVLCAVLVAYCNASSSVVAANASSVPTPVSSAVPVSNATQAPTTEPATTTAASFGFNIFPSILVLIAAFLVAALNFLAILGPCGVYETDTWRTHVDGVAFSGTV